MDHVFYNLHRSIYDALISPDARQKIHPKFFRQRGNDGMSVNWSKYSSSLTSKQRTKIPANNAVLGLNVGKVREIPMEVKHDPKPDNRAHSLVIGLDTDKRKKARLRDELALIATWEQDFG